MTWSLTLMGYLARRFMAVGADGLQRVRGACALDRSCRPLHAHVGSRHSDGRHLEHEPAQAAGHRAEIDALRGAARRDLRLLAHVEEQRTGGDACGGDFCLAVPDALAGGGHRSRRVEHDRVQPRRRRVPFAICPARGALRPGPGVAARGVVDGLVAASGRRRAPIGDPRATSGRSGNPSRGRDGVFLQRARPFCGAHRRGVGRPGTRTLAPDRCVDQRR